MTTEIATIDSAWGAGENIDASDVKLSKIWLMQGSSKAVKKKSAQIGELIDSITLEKYGDEKTPVELIVFDKNKIFEVCKQVPGERQEKFVKYVDITPENRNTEFEPGDGNRWRVCYNFFCLLVTKKGLKDLPVVVSMRKTSTDTAKGLISTFGVWAKHQKPSAHKVIKLSSEYVEDENPYHVFTFKEGRETTKEELAEAFGWYKNIRDSKIKATVDQSDVEGEEIPGKNTVDSETSFMS